MLMYLWKEKMGEWQVRKKFDKMLMYLQKAKNERITGTNGAQ